MNIPRISPNYFIAFQIYNPVICKRMVNIQNKIIEKNPVLKCALTNINTPHVLLALAYLKNEEKEKQLRERLRDWGEHKMKDHFNKPITLTFQGIGLFNREVAFVKIKECENYKRLCNLSKAMNDILSNGGFNCSTKREYIPHITLLKLTRNTRFFYRHKDVVNDLIELEKCNDDFGCQDIKDIRLLSLKRNDDGNYKCLWEVKTNESIAEEIETNKWISY